MVPSGLFGLYTVGACLLAVIGTSSAIQCFECTTADPDQQWCLDPFASSSASAVDCAKKDERQHEVCRKVTTHQWKVKPLDGDTEQIGTTISRFCGGPADTNEDYPIDECVYIQGAATETFDCGCRGDKCNSAGGIIASIAAISIATVAAMLFAK